MLHSLGAVTTLAANFEILASNIDLHGLKSDVGNAVNSLAGGLLVAAFHSLMLMVVVFILGFICLFVLLPHLICTIAFLQRKKYLQQGPGIFNRLASVPGTLPTAVALAILLEKGIGAGDGLVLGVFVLTTAALLVIWFGPWIQHVRTVRQDLQVTTGEAFRRVLRKNALRFCITVGLAVWLVAWPTIAAWA
jgi:hypothetical protein